MSTKQADTINQFIKAYVESKEGRITEQPNEILRVTYPSKSSPEEYTYNHALAREKKIPLIAPGSPTFQQILRDCLENGVLCQIILKPKENFETLLKGYFRDSPLECIDCDKVNVGEEEVIICVKPKPCYHRINNGKIISVKVDKEEPVRFFQFYFSVIFQNKLRSKNEEIITLTADEKGSIVDFGNFGELDVLDNEAIEIQDFKTKLKPQIVDSLKNVVDKKLDAILKEKLALFDLPLRKEKQFKLKGFDKRLKRERREQIISRKHDYDPLKWQVNYEALLKREEESFITNIAVKFVNLLVINTSKVRFEVNLDNNSAIHASFILGIDQAPEEASCPICRKTFSEGYATQDSLYVCKSCIRQSVDTGKIYSKKAALIFDETLKEYIERDSGFVCSVCGKRHSRLLEFKCSHDNSSVCIHHYGLCDICGKVFSKLNLSYTDEFKRQLCPKHAGKDKLKEQ